MEDITEAADVGKGAFYNYFASKEALAAEVLRGAVDALDRAYLADVGAGLPAVDRVHEVVRALERFFADHPEHLLLLHQARGSIGLTPGAGGDLHAALRHYLERLAVRLRGEVGTASAALEAALLVAGTVAGTRSFGWAVAEVPPAPDVAPMLAATLGPLLTG